LNRFLRLICDMRRKGGDFHPIGACGTTQGKEEWGAEIWVPLTRETQERRDETGWTTKTTFNAREKGRFSVEPAEAKSL